MAKEFSENYSVAREVLEEVNEALGQNLSKLMFEGSLEDLTLTENAQPAIMAASIAILRVLEQEVKFSIETSGKYVLGHSLGEYTALVAVESLALADAAKILKKRGQAMQNAVQNGMGGMAAILNLDINTLEAVTRQSVEITGGVCEISNDNAPGQVVISGDNQALEKAMELALEAGAKRALRLNVSAPFHCRLMQPAADEMADVLDKIGFLNPLLPIVSNVKAAPYSDNSNIRDLLVEQITGRVRFRESVEYLAGRGIGEFMEIGAGKVLQGMTKRIAPEAHSFSIDSLKALDDFAEQMIKA